MPIFHIRIPGIILLHNPSKYILVEYSSPFWVVKCKIEMFYGRHIKNYAPL